MAQGIAQAVLQFFTQSPATKIPVTKRLTTSRRLLPGLEQSFELEFAVCDPSVEQPVPAEHTVLVR